MRFRLTPMLMFALAATLSIKIGSVWTEVNVGIGRQSVAQGSDVAATTSPREAAAPTEDPAPIADETVPEQVAPADPASAQQAAKAPEESRRDDPFEYSDEEIEVLQQLAKRREELDLLARQIEEREALVNAAEQRMEQKMAELKALQVTVEDILKQRSEEEEKELRSLVKIYESMKPKDAAQVFEELDMDILLEVVDRMSERKAAPILALIDPTRAKELTLELAERRDLPLPP